MDITIIHGRFWPVGSVQVGKVDPAALTFVVVAVKPLVIINKVSVTTKKTPMVKEKLSFGLDVLSISFSYSSCLHIDI